LPFSTAVNIAVKVDGVCDTLFECCRRSHLAYLTSFDWSRLNELVAHGVGNP